MLSIIIPARNEADNLEDILKYFENNLPEVNFEVLIINDFSDDDTLMKAEKIFASESRFKIFDNKKKGLGGAINLGIEKANGDRVAIMMADMSDHIDDLMKYNNLIDKENLDAVLGSRFIEGSKIFEYPFQKLILNRLFNLFVSLIFWNKYNDYTNAFKIYKKEVLKDLMPLVSESFNIFLEIPLKAISRNYNYKIIPIKWTGRKKGKAKFKIKELRSKYLFTLIYCFIEKNLLNLKK
jgi:dolichol-phosphate mannosyltransferase